MRIPAERLKYSAMAAAVVLIALHLAASSLEQNSATVGSITAAVSWHEPPRLIGLEGGWTVELDPQAWTEIRLSPGVVVTAVGWVDAASPQVVRSARIRDGFVQTPGKSDGQDDDPDEPDGDDPDGDDKNECDDGDDECDDDDDDDECDEGDDDCDDDDDEDDECDEGDDDCIEDGDGDDDDSHNSGVVFELEGRLESTTQPDSFRMSGNRLYRVTSVTRFSGGISTYDDLIPGQILRIKARRLLSDDYVADEVELRGTGSLVDVEGLVLVVGAESVNIEGVGPITVTTNTQFDGDSDRLADLQPGWKVIARIFVDQYGGWQAVRIRGLSPADPTVEDEEFQPNQALVIPVDGINRQELATRHGATIIGEVGDLAILFEWQTELDDSLLAALSADDDVRGVEPNYLFRDPESVRRRFPVVDRAADGDSVLTQPATAVIQLDKALEWATGRGTIVAILDTGVDPDHPMLQGKIASGGMDLVDGDFEPWETADGIDQDADGDVDESSGHGTFVASLVATGAPDAQILPYRVLDDDGGGSAYSLAVALADAIRNRVDIVNISLVYRSRSDAVDLLLEEAAAAGIVIICSAGNDGGGSLPFPAADRHVLAVTALTADGAAPADFANLADQVVLSAPGEDVYGALPPDLFGTASGTSMAAPFVTAAAALILEVDPGLSPDLVRFALEQSGRGVAGRNWAGVVLQVHSTLRLLEPIPQVSVTQPTHHR